MMIKYLLHQVTIDPHYDGKVLVLILLDDLQCIDQLCMVDSSARTTWHIEPFSSNNRIK
jgi:hypothetical protein